MSLAYVGYAEGGNIGFVTTISTAAREFTSGNTIVVGVRWSENVTITGVTDTAGNVYTALTQRGVSEKLQIFYATNIVGDENNVVTATFSGNAAYVAIVAAEFSGVASASALDAEVGGLASGPSLSSPALTTTNADDVVFVIGTIGAVVTFSAGSGYTLIDGQVGIPQAGTGAQYKITTETIASTAQTMTASGSGGGVIAVAAFKAASSSEIEGGGDLAAPIAEVSGSGAVETPLTKLTVSGQLIDENGDPVVSPSGIVVELWEDVTDPTGAPDQTLTNQSADESGNFSWEFSIGSLTGTEDVFVRYVIPDNPPMRFGMGVFTPTYE